MTDSSPAFIHHAANCAGNHTVPGSLPAIRACLSAEASRVEVDVIALKGGDFALLHNVELETCSTGSGPVYELTAAQVRALEYAHNGQSRGVPVGTLTEAVELIRSDPQLEWLQLDLKPYTPMTDAVLSNLLEIVAPIKKRVLISSVGDWAVRRLRSLDPTLALGFDPLLYLDIDKGETRDGMPPFRVGAYNFLDDHPLSMNRWGSTGAYLAARAEALLAQAPVENWFIRAEMLILGLENGFDWIAFLHAAGRKVAAWTLDADQPRHPEWARRLAEAGVDYITSNTVNALEESLKPA
jgi:glycerophosphoryl diester phosphodiesterase